MWRSVLAFVLLPVLALAQPIGNGPPITITVPPNAGGAPGPYLPLAGNATVTGPVTFSGGITSSSYNAWAPQFSALDSSNSVAVGGSGYNPGDVLVLNDGCATHTQLVLNGQNAANAAVTFFNIMGKGLCSSVPANPISVLSTTGTGTGATFNLTYAPVGAIVPSGSVGTNGGNLFITGTIPLLYQGEETTVVGERTGGLLGSGNFNAFFGHGTEGGAGCVQTSIYIDSTIALGVDVVRNGCGHSRATLTGNSILVNYTQVGTSANNYLFGTSAYGAFALRYWNSPTAFPWLSAFGDSSCTGAPTGTVSFTGGSCFGANIGLSLTTAQNFLIMAGGGASNVAPASGNCTSNQGFILIASGAQTVDCVAATNRTINIENTITATGTGTPSTSVVTAAGSLYATGGCFGGHCGATPDTALEAVGSGFTAITVADGVSNFMGISANSGSNPTFAFGSGSSNKSLIIGSITSRAWAGFSQLGSISTTGVMDMKGFSTNGTAGLASTTCVINATNVAAGITITITGGLTTAKINC